ncbi:MAG: vanadium-dependent haloperoxidase [Oligoflexus sp.]
MTVFKVFKEIYLALILCLLSSHGVSYASGPKPFPEGSFAYKWLDFGLEAAAREVDRVGARPTIISRQTMLFTTAMFDAWAAYDSKAVGTILGSNFRRPEKERTQKNQEQAIAYAGYRILEHLFGTVDQQWLEKTFREAGFEPKLDTKDPSSPIGVGNMVAAALIDARRYDGSNSDGSEVGSNGKPYSDYTFYSPRNTVDKIFDPDRWQQITFTLADGKKLTPNFLTPHWYRVKPVALESSSQFRAPPPPLVGSEQLKKEVEENVRFNSSLSLEQKAIVEFMRDGPRSTGQSGHWLRFAQDVSRRDKHNLEQDVKLYFAVGTACFDAFIAAWETKRFYDTSRPWTLVRHYFKGKTIDGYVGPGQGVKKIKADEWLPYSPAYFITPPFPGYVSGHSTVSAAAARTLALFTGNDRFGEVERREARSLTEYNVSCRERQKLNGKIPSNAQDSCLVELQLPTFTATAEMAGISRLMGGFHIQADNVAGLVMGSKIADYIWPKIKAYFDGTSGVMAH